MRVPISWLREYVDFPTTRKRSPNGLQCSGFRWRDRTRPAISGVVSAGSSRSRNIPTPTACWSRRSMPAAIAAHHRDRGDKRRRRTRYRGRHHRRPAAATHHRPRTMRGVASEGMMISADELALPAEWFEDGILQFETSIEARTRRDRVLRPSRRDPRRRNHRQSPRRHVDRRARARACGIVRRAAETSAVCKPGHDGPAGAAAAHVSIESSDCRRFIVQRFDGARVGPAPAWMRIRLALAGQRPINNLVDVSNYVMLETGQPLHFYDAAHVPELRLSYATRARTRSSLRSTASTER